MQYKLLYLQYIRYKDSVNILIVKLILRYINISYYCVIIIYVA